MKNQNPSIIDASASGGQSFCLLPSASCLSTGFTLIEILVALVIVAMTVSVVLESQIISLKIEQKARALQLFRFETQRIFSVTRRAETEAQLIQLLASNAICRVKSEPVKIERGTNVLVLIRHELSSENLPSFSSVFYTLVPENPRRRPDAVGGPAGGPKPAAAP